MYSTLTAIVIVGLVAWTWARSLRAREAAARAARRLCDSEGVQFLDDTVALASLRPALSAGRPALRRVYAFEFSRHGNDRRPGSVTLTGDRIESMYIEPAPDPVPTPAAVAASGEEAGSEPRCRTTEPAPGAEAQVIDLAAHRHRR